MFTLEAYIVLSKIYLGQSLDTGTGFSVISVPNDGYLKLVFFSTVFIYCIHRIVGIRKLATYRDEGRFQVIAQYKSHILVYIVLSVIGIGWSLSMINLYQMVWPLVPVGIISMLYTLPLFSQGKRLRDFHYIKILLISFVWAYIATLPFLVDLPIYLQETVRDVELTWANFFLPYFIEKFIFILAITLPFDIRDLGIDQQMGLKTIPMRFGVDNTYKLCYLLLVLGACIQLYLISFEVHNNWRRFEPMMGMYLIVGMIIWWTKGEKSDLYYSGLLDGTLIIRGLIMLSCIL